MNRLAYWTLVSILLVCSNVVSAQRRDGNVNRSLKQGTNIRVRLPDNLDSDRNRNGDQFEAILDHDLASYGRVLARAGSVVYYRLVDVTPGGRYSTDRSRVSLTLTGIQVKAEVIPIETNIITINTAPSQNQRLNFKIQRNTSMDPSGYHPLAERRNEPGRIMPLPEIPRTDNRMERDLDADRGMADHGNFHWSGRVDGSDYIELRRNQVTIRHMESQPITGATYNVSSPLPRRPIKLQLNKLQGRGKVVLYEQPLPGNGYMASVYIEDSEGGGDFYEFELNW